MEVEDAFDVFGADFQPPSPRLRIMLLRGGRNAVMSCRRCIAFEVNIAVRELDGWRLFCLGRVRWRIEHSNLFASHRDVEENPRAREHNTKY